MGLATAGATPTMGATPTTPATHAIPTGWPNATIPTSPTAWHLLTVLTTRITRRAATAWCAIRLATWGTRAFVAVNDSHCRLLLLYPGTNDLSQLAARCPTTSRLAPNRAPRMGSSFSMPHVAPLDSPIGRWDRRCRVCSEGERPAETVQEMKEGACAAMSLRVY